MKLRSVQLISSFSVLSFSSALLFIGQVVLVVKNLPASAGDIRDMGLIPGSERSPGGLVCYRVDIDTQILFAVLRWFLSTVVSILSILKMMRPSFLFEPSRIFHVNKIMLKKCLKILTDDKLDKSEISRPSYMLLFK